MKTEISVIVPVYNVEPYLRRCLDSIINQSMKEIEILVIDDGSTDRSSEICDEYAKLDNRIKVTHQENRGLSQARNVGLDQAQGKYVMFVDSDDFVSKDFCRIPYLTAIKNNSDLVLFRYNHVVNDNIQSFPSNYIEYSVKNGYKTRQEAFDIMFNITSVGVWNKLYLKSLFNKIKFPIGMIYEDIGTSYKLILNSNSIFFINNVLYYYLLRTDGLSKSSDSKSKFDLINMYYDMQEELNNNNLFFKGDKGVALLSFRYLLFFGRNSELSNKCKKILDDYLHKNKKREDFNNFKKILFILSRKTPVLFDALCFAEKIRNWHKPF